jgi:hypothetical protein
MTSGWVWKQRRRLARTSLLFLIAVIALVTFASATTVTVTKANEASYGGYLVKGYYEDQNPPVTGCTLPCLTVDTQTAQPSGSGSFTLPNGASSYLWSPQITSATTISAGTWGLDFWASATAYSDVSITLTNNQVTATPTGFQQEIVVNPSSYTSYEASDLGNVRFCVDTSCHSMLYSWLESCASSPCNTATSAVFWVNLGSSTVSANGGSVTFYMCFLPITVKFDGVYAGEIPTLSSSYARYDNGASVFSLYFNGNTPVSSFVAYGGYTVSQVTGVAYGTGTANAIEVTGSAATKDAQFAYNTGVSNAGYVEEVSWESQTANNKGFLGLADSPNLGSIQNAIGVSADSAFTGEYITAGTVTSGTTVTGTYSKGAWLYGTMVYSGPTSTSYTAAESSSLYPGSLTAIGGHPLGTAGTLYFAPMSHHTGTSAATYYYNWARLRLYPPNDVMPSVSLGAVSSNRVSISAYVTGSTGAVVGTVASNVQSPNIGTSMAEYGMSFAGSQATVPSNGYISIVITGAVDACTFYWGGGQPTNFQVSYTDRAN